MRKLLQTASRGVRNGIIMFATFVAVMLICMYGGKAVWGVDENNVLQAPDWFAVFALFASVISSATAPKIVDKFSAAAGSKKSADNTIELPAIAEEPKPIEFPVPEEAVEPQPEEPPKPTGLDAVDLMDGHEFEYWCAAILQKNGFQDVEVTKASGDQGVDVLASKDGVSYAIQCKCYSHDLGNTPVQEVNAGKMFYHRHIGVVMTNRYFTQGAKDAAAATGVLLWDRDKLQEFIHRGAKVNRYMYEDF